MALTAPEWWRGAVGYEVYLRSFADSDGDGIGDLDGLRDRLPHLAQLGVDVVWVTPFYPSPQADHGYDVADYTGVEPVYGDLDVFAAVLDAAHDLGLRVLVDLVPNHTSDRHPWFQQARRSRDDPRRDWYVWRDPAPDGGPPNNWVSHFGGPAWSLDEPSGQYFLHLFLPEQPDLNWANPAVRDAFDDILRCWLDRGVDGFRIDVAHSLVKDPSLRDNPLRAGPPPDGASPPMIFDAYDHRYDLDQAEVVDVYRRWRRIVEPYDALLLGEVYLLDPGRVLRYLDGTGLHAAFWFPTLRTGWEPAAMRAALTVAADARAAGLSWPLSSHDDPRAASRFGGGALGAERALAYLVLLTGLPGVPFLYYGDELGLDNVAVHRPEDPLAARNPGATGRDGQRTPMPWHPGPGAGFTSGSSSWLPIGDRAATETVVGQSGRRGSVLQRVRALLDARHTVPAMAGDDPVTWLDAGDDVLAYTRPGLVAACNAGAAPTRVLLPEDVRTIAFATAPVAVDGDAITLPPNVAALLCAHR